MLPPLRIRRGGNLPNNAKIWERKTMKYRFLRFPGGKTKAVTFSYDDGCRQDLRTLKVLDSYGLKGTFNINSARIAKESGGWELTKEEIQENILEKGHEVAVHGQWHKAPGLVRIIDGIQDVLNCRLELEEMFGLIIRGMAYPDSGITRYTDQTSYEEIKRYLKDLDIVYSRTLGQDNNEFDLPSDWYQWMPTAHHDNPQILNWAKEFVELDIDKQYCARRMSRLFYIWGHSFEFDRNDNWQHLEDICGVLAKKEDIWYATNIEIYEYVKAYDALVYSADGKRVYNPSLKTIWFDYDGVLYQIAPGETILI